MHLVGDQTCGLVPRFGDEMRCSGCMTHRKSRNQFDNESEGAQAILKWGQLGLQSVFSTQCIRRLEKLGETLYCVSNFGPHCINCNFICFMRRPRVLEQPLNGLKFKRMLNSHTLFDQHAHSSLEKNCLGAVWILVRLRTAASHLRHSTAYKSCPRHLLCRTRRV